MEHNLNIDSRMVSNDNLLRVSPSPFEILMNFGVSEEDIVADIGCGNGVFTIPLGRIITKNKIYALDISDKVLDEVDKKATFNELNNIITIKTDNTDLKLESSSVTFALACDVLHENKDKESFLQEVKRILKDNGKLAIFEHSAQDENQSFKFKDLMSLEDTKIALIDAGFQISKISEFDDISYGILAVKA